MPDIATADLKLANVNNVLPARVRNWDVCCLTLHWPNSAAGARAGAGPGAAPHNMM